MQGTFQTMCSHNPQPFHPSLCPGPVHAAAPGTELTKGSIPQVHFYIQSEYGCYSAIHPYPHPWHTHMNDQPDKLKMDHVWFRLFVCEVVHL